MLPCERTTKHVPSITLGGNSCPNKHVGVGAVTPPHLTACAIFIFNFMLLLLDVCVCVSACLLMRWCQADTLFRRGWVGGWLLGGARLLLHALDTKQNKCHQFWGGGGGELSAKPKQTDRCAWVLLPSSLLSEGGDCTKSYAQCYGFLGVIQTGVFFH